MARRDGRLPGQLRKITVVKDYMKHAEGSCLIEFGQTRVICTASVEGVVPLSSLEVRLEDVWMA